MIFKEKEIREYLNRLYNEPVIFEAVEDIGRGAHGKGYRIVFTVGGKQKRLVLKGLEGDRGLGHDYPSDRAAVFILAKESYKFLPKHVGAIDVGIIRKDGTIGSMGDFEDFFLLMDEAEGSDYFGDLRLMKDKEILDELDRKRIMAMVRYLAEIHSVKKDSADLYWRKLRDTIGHGECLMGVLDTYRDVKFTDLSEMAEIEKKCVEWRKRLKPFYSRCCQIHGDFHPGNILFKEGDNFILLDRSRGMFGEPADDVTALTINYIFMSVMAHGELRAPYDEALELFYDEYVYLTGDKDIFYVVAPFYAFRGVVIANPLFYPDVSNENRKKIFNFIHGVLDTDRFDLKDINRYLRL
ncbi:MAG: aminoglycoside phosphotransferase family protein [Nitrospirota bacterium]